MPSSLPVKEMLVMISLSLPPVLQRSVRAPGEGWRNLNLGDGNKAVEAATPRSSHSPAPQIRPSAPSRVPECSLPRPSHIYMLSTHMHPYVHTHAVRAHIHTPLLIRRPRPSSPGSLYSLPRAPAVPRQHAHSVFLAPRPARLSILYPAQPQSSRSSRPIVVCDPAEHFQGK